MNGLGVQGDTMAFEPVPLPPVPEPPPATFHYAQLGLPSRVWLYRDAGRRIVAAVARYEIDNGKTIRPWRHGRTGNAEPEWELGVLPEPRPLYQFDTLIARHAASVLVCEGEKAADAAAAIFPAWVVTTSQGGAMAAAKSDWSPVNGRRVVVWPDNDEPGRRYAADVAKLAAEAGAASVAVVAVPADWPEGWDLADPLPEGVTSETLAQMLIEAKPVREAAPRAEATTGPQAKAAPPPSPARQGGGGPSQVAVLLKLAEEASLFHAPDGVPYADVKIGGHRQTWPLRSRNFRRWLARRFYEMRRTGPNSQALAAAATVIEGNAAFDAPERVVGIRVAELAGRIYLDLGDADWRAVEIDADGWRVLNEPPVRFRRAAGMRPLPVPVAGGSIDLLRRFLNVKSDNDFVLAVAWLLEALRPRGPYPVLALSGEQGSAKSSFAAILRALVDPNTAPLRSLPREDRDLFIAANNAHVLAFDNISGLSFWLSDTLCRLATGGGFATRQLYSDSDEVIFDGQRPVILNGISDFVDRADLADRALFLALEPIPEDRRRPESELWAEFEAVRPRILGALLDAVSMGLRRLPETRLPALPRMADFALWVSACEAALWPEGTFIRAYDTNRAEAVSDMIDSDPVASVVFKLFSGVTEWNGTMTSLLKTLTDEDPEQIKNSKMWPTTARALSARLRRAMPALRKVGIEVTFMRGGKERTRAIRITSVPTEKEGNFASTSSASSATESKNKKTNDLLMPSQRTKNSEADANAPTDRAQRPPSVRHNSLTTNTNDEADAADAKKPSQLTKQQRIDRMIASRCSFNRYVVKDSSK